MVEVFFNNGDTKMSNKPVGLNDDQYKTFGKEFLKHYLYDGYGTMPKKEIDILVFHLISESKDIKGKTNYEVANKLSLTESKVKGLILESSLKYNPADHKAVVIKIVSRLAEEINRSDSKTENIKISLENPIEKREFERAVKKLGCYVDYTLNKEVLKVDAFLLLEIILDNLDKKQLKDIKDLKNKREWKGINNVSDFKKKFKDLIKDPTNATNIDGACKIIFRGIKLLI